ncbi:MAG: hypothetical protein LH647_05795 [Leptolyngbyaceae cyanobacterium CAN_BIN12]|nr:hypothetical protein [Leptolyngbyaceae cyanobacterium CAN_BIN12]
MSPLLQRVLTELNQLAPEEQWQVMEHLMRHLQEGAVVIAKPQYENDRLARVEKILQETEGSWGNLSLDEIDAQLAHQRQFDWGE